MAPAMKELEIKLVGAPPDVAAFRTSALMEALIAGEGAWERLKSIYYDTPQEDLAANALSLRVRDDGAGRTRTIKYTPPEGSAVERAEIETRLTKSQHAADDFGGSGFETIVERFADTITPIAQTETDRWSVIATLAGAKIEIAIDLGRAERWVEGKAASVAAIAEVELELLKGDPRVLFALVREILSQSNDRLRVSVASKLTQALNADGLEFRSVTKAKKINLDTDGNAADACARALLNYATRLIELAPMVVTGRNRDALRQARVILRRLRTLFRIYRKPLKNNKISKLTARAGSTARLLGRVRDLDVFLETGLALSADDYAELGFQQLRARTIHLRGNAWDDAASFMNSGEFQCFVLDLLEAAYLQQWRRAPSPLLALPGKEFAALVLDKAHDRVLLKCRDFDPSDVETAHRLRLAVKKLRYGAQLYRSLYPAAARKPFFVAMSGLQDRLGRLNDAVNAQQRANHLAKGEGADAAKAAGYICGHYAAFSKAAIEQIARDLEQFEQLPPFWGQK